MLQTSECDLYVGNLAFLAMLIGMNNSSGSHCVQCEKKARDFCCDNMHPHEMRTKASLTECLNEFNTRRLTSRGVQNHKGVNSLGLLDIDPRRIIVPILCCPMGLVDKLLATFKDWTTHEVEVLPGPAHDISETHRSNEESHAVSKALEDQTRQLHLQNNIPQTALLLREAYDARAKARSEGTESKVELR